MTSNFEFHDYSVQVKDAIKAACGSWLDEVSFEIESQIKRNISMEGWTHSERTALRDSYDRVVDKENGKAQVGSTLEQAYWEEWGTGSHADTAKNGGKQGRQDWWVYVSDRVKPEGEAESTHYKSQERAEAVAQGMREDGLDAHASDGREPHYTMENAFIKTAPRAKRDLERRLKAIDGLGVKGTSGGGQKYE